MASETDAFLVSATLHHFGMTTMQDTPKKNLIPSGMQKTMWKKESGFTIKCLKYLTHMFQALYLV